MSSKDLWLVHKNHATVKFDSNGFSWNENLGQEQNLTAKSRNVKENARKIKSVFVIRAALGAEKLGCCFEYHRSWNNTLEKLGVPIPIRVLNERSVTDGGNLWPLWLVILKSFCYSIGDTLYQQYSWQWALVSSTFLAVVSWNGLEHSGRKVRWSVSFNWP